jgi:hypothetical protein
MLSNPNTTFFLPSNITTMAPTSPQGGNMKTSAGVALPLQATDVVASINGPIADVQVTQVFKNNTSETIEATYSVCSERIEGRVYERYEMSRSVAWIIY